MGRKRHPRPVRCFVPKGRSEYVIYAVCLREHLGVVKVGRTTRWKNRRKVYASWNLAIEDAVLAERVFTITEEFVDLPALEAALLSAMPFPRRHGLEWFRANFDDVCEVIDRFLSEHDISYV